MKVVCVLGHLTWVKGDRHQNEHWRVRVRVRVMARFSTLFSVVLFPSSARCLPFVLHTEHASLLNIYGMWCVDLTAVSLWCKIAL